MKVNKNKFTLNKMTEKLDEIIKPFVDKVFLYDDIAEAHNRMENRNHFGKIILVPN